MYRYGCTQFRRSRPEHQTTLYSNYGEWDEIYKEKNDRSRHNRSD